MRSFFITVVFALVVVGCSTTKNPGFDAAVDTVEETTCETQTCSSMDECDDGIDCTRDTCVIGGCCLFEPDDDECPYGQVCDPDLGCVAYECMSDGDCDDGRDCTDDTCLFDHTCNHADSCPDGEHCEEEGCVVDVVECTTNADCQDDDFCNGEERCDPEFGCMEPAGPRECADSDPCTVDECDTELNMCTFTCDPTIAGCEEECPVDPYSGCFSIATTVAQTCAMGYVSYNFNQICFERVGLSIEVTAGTLRLAETPAPDGMHFSVSQTVSGACDEYYNITGDFSDADHFDGLWTATFTPSTPGGCFGSGCTSQSIVLSGTRI